MPASLVGRCELLAQLGAQFFGCLVKRGAGRWHGRQHVQQAEVVDRFSPYVLALLRIAVALLFMQHGLQKLLQFPAPSPHGTPPMWTLGWYAGVIEAVGGPLIALGLFTRATAFLASGEMAIGYFLFHAPHNFWPVMNEGDLAVLFCFVFFYLVFSGPGAWSVDGFLKRREQR